MPDGPGLTAEPDEAIAAGGTVGRCQAESLDGHEHSEDVTEYMGICVRGHERRGLICGACAGYRVRGPAAVTCAECPEGDPRPRVLMLAEVWDEYGLAEVRDDDGHG